MIKRHDNIEALVHAVCMWGVSKGINGINEPKGTGTTLKQLEKTQEELIETRDAALRYTLATDEQTKDKAFEDFVDGIGDMLITIILAADLMSVPIHDALEVSLHEISKRTGTMVDGMFVKDTPPVVSRAVTDDDDIDWSDLDPAKACTLGDETCESCQ